MAYGFYGSFTDFGRVSHHRWIDNPPTESYPRFSQKSLAALKPYTDSSPEKTSRVEQLTKSRLLPDESVRLSFKQEASTVVDDNSAERLWALTVAINEALDKGKDVSHLLRQADAIVEVSKTRPSTPVPPKESGSVTLVRENQSLKKTTEKKSDAPKLKESVPFLSVPVLKQSSPAIVQPKTKAKEDIHRDYQYAQQLWREETEYSRPSYRSYTPPTPRYQSPFSSKDWFSSYQRSYQQNGVLGMTRVYYRVETGYTKGDGNCMYHALNQQLQQKGISISAKDIREKSVAAMSERVKQGNAILNEVAEELLSYFEEKVKHGASAKLPSLPKSLEEYFDKMAPLYAGLCEEFQKKQFLNEMTEHIQAIEVEPYLIHLIDQNKSVDTEAARKIVGQCNSKLYYVRSASEMANKLISYFHERVIFNCYKSPHSLPFSVVSYFSKMATEYQRLATDEQRYRCQEKVIAHIRKACLESYLNHMKKDGTYGDETALFTAMEYVNANYADKTEGKKGFTMIVTRSQSRDLYETVLGYYSEREPNSPNNILRIDNGTGGLHFNTVVAVHAATI